MSLLVGYQDVSEYIEKYFYSERSIHGSFISPPIALVATPVELEKTDDMVRI